MVACTASGARLPGIEFWYNHFCVTLGTLLTSLCPNVCIYIKGMICMLHSSQSWCEDELLHVKGLRKV